MKMFREKKQFKYHKCYKNFVELKEQYKNEYEIMFQCENVSTITKLHIMIIIDKLLFILLLFPIICLKLGL